MSMLTFNESKILPPKLHSQKTDATKISGKIERHGIYETQNTTQETGEENFSRNTGRPELGRGPADQTSSDASRGHMTPGGGSPGGQEKTQLLIL